MSNARYFADGVDFYRVLYDSGSTEGPYISHAAARRVGESSIKVRQSWRWVGQERVSYEWQSETSYKIQKLIPDFESEEDRMPSWDRIEPIGLILKWVDFDA